MYEAKQIIQNSYQNFRQNIGNNNKENKYTYFAYSPL